MKKILIIDDEKDNLQMLEKRLTSAGYSVFTADNGFDALTLAKSKCPDLIILDIVMPTMEGGEVARKLKENSQTRDIPVMFLTAILSKEEDTSNNHRVANNIILAKPVDSKELLSQINKLISNATAV